LRFDKMEQRLDGMDLRLDKMEQRLDGMGLRFDKMEQRFDTMENDIKEIKSDVRTIKEQIIDLEAKNANNHLEIKTQLDNLSKEISILQVVSGKNMADIAMLKAVK
ncbi:MAG: hypothetical protein PWR27_221, partial [Petroclostridium sp.]|nr:hypothetical protein [Petroclostridium sp.]